METEEIRRSSGGFRPRRSQEMEDPKSRNGGMAEWRNGGMVEWRNGGMAEWRNGGMAEWRKMTPNPKARNGGK